MKIYKLLISTFLGVLILYSSYPTTAQSPPGFLVNYPLEPDPILSTNYSVKVNGELVPVYNVGGANKSSYAHFSFAGTVEVEVTVNGTVDTYNLSPRSYNIASSKEGSVIKFSLNKPRKLLIHNVSATNEMLAILADPIEDDTPNLDTPNVTNVLDYGVSSDGSGDNTSKIQQAINGLSADGILYFPPGKYTTGCLQPKSNTALYLAGGAVLHAIHNYEKIKNPGDAVINISEGVNNVQIYGRGVIDGSAENLFADNRWAVTVRSRPGTGYHTLKGIILRNSQRFTTMLWGHHTIINNLKIVQTGAHPNVDGIDLIGNDHYYVDDVFVLSGDDCVANNPNAGKAYGGVFRNAVLLNNESGRNIFMGYAEDGARGFRYENIDLIDNLDAENPSIELRVGNGEFSDVHFRNIRVENTGRNLVQLTPYFDLTKYVNEKGSGSLEDITFSDIWQEKAGSGSNSVGIYYNDIGGPSNTVDVNFSNYYVENEQITNLTDGKFEVSPYANVTFDNNSLPIINIDANQMMADELSATSGQFTITRSGNLEEPVTVGYTIRGTATNGNDYTTIPDIITIPANATSQTVSINPLQDDLEEGFETVLIALNMDWENYIVGANYLAQAVISDAYPLSSVGTGLAYALYGNKTLSGTPLATGTDAMVNFNWNLGGKAADLPINNFSVRWTGQVEAQYDEEYTFYTRSDDGVRLWVDGKLLVDNWTNHAETEDQGKITLQAGKKYDIKLEYYEKGGQAVCEFRWSSVSQGKQLIPQERLYPVANSQPGTTAYAVRARGLQGTEEMALLIGGETVQSWTVSKSMQNYSYTGSQTGSVRVAITNDQGVNHDLVVDKLTVDGTVYQAEAQAVNTGVWQNGSCGGTKSAWLHCSGYIEFDLESANARQADQRNKLPTPGQTASLLVVYPNPSADARFTVQGITANAQVHLYDLQGKRARIKVQRADQQRRLIQTYSPPGLYLLRVTQPDGSQYQQKVAIE